MQQLIWADTKADDPCVVPEIARVQQNPASNGAKPLPEHAIVRTRENNRSELQVVETAVVSNERRHHALLRNIKAGDENRTHMASLEGCGVEIVSVC